MSTCLSLKKRFKKLIANSKGFSSVIGTTFMVLVMMFLGTSVFLWTLSQNTIYNEEVRARNLEEADRIEEHVVATLNGSYTVSGDQVSFLAMLKNTGSVAVQIIRLWVLDTDPTNRRYANKSLDLKLNPGDVLNLVDSSDTAVYLPGADVNHAFVSWFVTARGNTIPLEIETETETEDGVIVAQVAQGIGSLAFDFDSLIYFTTDGNKFVPYPSGYEAYKVPAVDNLVFGFKITNYNVDGYDIALDGGANGGTFMWSYFAGVPGHQLGPVWFLVNNQTDTILPTYSPITLVYNESRFLLFSLQTNKFDNLQKGAVGAINLVFYGNFTTTIDGDTEVKGNYGQNVPFVTIYFY